MSPRRAPKFVEDPEAEIRTPPCDRCNTTGVIPYWRLVEGQVHELQARCLCWNGLQRLGLPSIDGIPGVPKGLSAAQMSALVNAMVSHPNLTPLEALGFIPKSREDLARAFAAVSPELAREMSSRFCPDKALMDSWLEMRAALMAEYQEEATAEMPF